MKDEIIVYRCNELAEHIEVSIDNETVWLTQQQMAALFNQTKQNISLHINNCFRENELEPISVVKESLTTAKDGKKYTTKYYNLDVIISIELDEKSNVQKMHIPNSDKPVIFYNLDVILSVGYRVNSKQGTQFRQWATKRLKDYLLKGYVIIIAVKEIYHLGASLKDLGKKWFAFIKMDKSFLKNILNSNLKMI